MSQRLFFINQLTWNRLGSSSNFFDRDGNGFGELIGFSKHARIDPSFSRGDPLACSRC
jgi:hypothetical protein